MQNNPGTIPMIMERLDRLERATLLLLDAAIEKEIGAGHRAALASLGGELREYMRLGHRLSPE